MLKIKVSFDFDGVLDRQQGINLAKKLIAEGNDVWIITSRYDDNNTITNQSNEDVWTVATELDIPDDKVIFTNMRWKASWLKDKNFDMHIDDSPFEIAKIEESVEGCNAVNFIEILSDIFMKENFKKYHNVFKNLKD